MVLIFYSDLEIAVRMSRSTALFEPPPFCSLERLPLLMVRLFVILYFYEYSTLAKRNFLRYEQ